MREVDQLSCISVAIEVFQVTRAEFEVIPVISLEINLKDG